MTPQQPQQELIEIIEKLGGVLKTAQIENTSDWMDYVFGEVIPEAERKLNEICSRLHASAETPIIYCNADGICLLLNLDCPMEKRNQCKECIIPKHDAAIRTEERNGTLDEVYDKLTGKRIFNLTHPFLRSSVQSQDGNSCMVKLMQAEKTKLT